MAPGAHEQANPAPEARADSITAANADTERPRKRRRARTGCLTCRARRVKCDETHPQCTNCANRFVECTWADAAVAGVVSSGHNESTPAPTTTTTTSAPASRTPTPTTPSPPSTPAAVIGSGTVPTASNIRSLACLRCRSARSKCSQTRPACDRCAARGHACEYPQRKGSLTPAAQSWIRRVQSEVTATSDSASSTIQLPCQDRIERLAIAFFLHVHVYRANGFFERDKTLAAVRERRLARPLLLGLCAVGSRFAKPDSAQTIQFIQAGDTNQETSEATVRAWAAEAGRLVMASTEVSRENVEAALLLTIYAQQAGRFAQSHLWAGIAMQQAVSLGLHRETSVMTSTGGRTVSKSFTDGERDRRLFFACYSMNRFLSNGAPEAIQCPATRIRLRLPCDGFNFRMGLAAETPYAMLETGGDTGPSMPGWMFKNVGAMGFWVRLVGIRAMVKQYFYGMMEARRVAAEQDHEDGDWVSSMDVPPGSGGGASTGGTVGTGMPPPSQAPQVTHHHPSSSSSAFSPSALTATSSTSPNAPPSYVAPWVPDSPFVTCLAKLASLRESLPLRLQLGRALRTRPHDWPALGQIVLFYLWWNVCHIELCSVALPGYPQSLDAETLAAAPDGWAAQTRQSCLRHAQAITDTLALVERELPPNGHRGSLVLYDHTIAHAVYLSLRVQLEHWQANDVDVNGVNGVNGVNDGNDIHDGDHNDDMTPVALQARLEMMLGYVEKTSVYFHSVHLVLREMRHMMSRHGLSSQHYPENESRADTPPPPWFQHQKTLDSRSLAERADMDAVNLEAILLELLPDCNAHTSWVRAYEYDANAAYLPVNHVADHSSSVHQQQQQHTHHANLVAALQTPTWEHVPAPVGQVSGHVPALWMGQDAHTVGTAMGNHAVANGTDPNNWREQQQQQQQMSAFGVLDGWGRVADLPRLDSLLPN
ncbi:hypothetical protein SCUCBS95973_008330 [Sporothrix curviconia]|uniref:Zn(2)-C6 fungal-type domain-containing protein n=1 Tax=Sporothrix curviconia TaxID=1260050 RepID=A0ABP0CM53_9PEZI